MLQHVNAKPRHGNEDVWTAWESTLIAAAPSLEGTAQAGFLSGLAIRESHPETATCLMQRVRACSLLATAATASRQNDEVRSTLSS